MLLCVEVDEKQNHISVLRRTERQKRRAGAFFFSWSFIEFSPVPYAKSNFLAKRINPCLAVVKLCYPRLTQGRLLSKLYARV